MNDMNIQHEPIKNDIEVDQKTTMQKAVTDSTIRTIEYWIGDFQLKGNLKLIKIRSFIQFTCYAMFCNTHITGIGKKNDSSPKSDVE